MRLRLNQYFKKGSVSDEYSLHSRENTPQMLGDTGSACGSKLRLIRFHLESKYDQQSGSMAPLGVCSCLGLVGLLCGVPAYRRFALRPSAYRDVLHTSPRRADSTKSRCKLLLVHRLCLTMTLTVRDSGCMSTAFE